MAREKEDEGDAGEEVAGRKQSKARRKAPGNDRGEAEEVDEDGCGEGGARGRRGISL